MSSLKSCIQVGALDTRGHVQKRGEHTKCNNNSLFKLLKLRI